MLVTGSGKKEIFVLGILFILGIFTTYLFIGVGILSFLQNFKHFKMFPMLIFPLFACMAMIFAIYSFVDAVKAKKGDVSTITLRLPKLLKRASHYIIRKRAIKK